MPRLLPEAEALNSRLSTWTLCAAAGAALAAAAGLLGRWCADPTLGWLAVLAAAAPGAALAARAPAPADGEARAWAAGGALAALGFAALLRFLGLALPDPAFLERPLGGAALGAFVLGQAALLAALAAGAWTRAVRGGGVPAAGAALLGAAAAAAAARRIECSVVLAAAGLAALAAAEFAERPWAERASSPLRARAFAAAAVVGLGLSAAAPGLLRDVWLARLNAAYPGGRLLSYADDGASVWAAYRFSNGDGVLLRDGVLQNADPASGRLALRALLGQTDFAASVLLVRPPEPGPALAAAADGASFVLIEDGPPAQAAALDALGGGPGWRKALKAPETPGAKPNSALLLLPRPLSARGLDLRALRSRLSDGAAAAALLLPPGASARATAALTAAAAAAFGHARAADLPRGVLIVASTAEVATDPDVLFNRLSVAAKLADATGSKTLADGLRWRAK